MPGLTETRTEPTKRRVHGGPQPEELERFGIKAADLLDFSSNLNPYGPCPEVLEAIRSAACTHYPDPSARLARTQLAARLGVPVDCIAVGNGAAELLWTLARVLVRPESTVMSCEPTFCEFRAAAEASGGYVCEWRALPEHGFAIDLSGISRLVRKHQPRVLYLCSPNTPTGAALPGSEIQDFARAHPELLLILDQSFLSLSVHHADLALTWPNNVVCVRSLTKDHAIAGVRVGYVLGTPALLSRLEAQRPAWTVNAFAQAAIAAISQCPEFVDESRKKVLRDRDQLVLGLRAAGFSVVPSSACFVMVKVEYAGLTRARLLEHQHLLVRDCSSFGLREYIRVAARPEPQSGRLIAALTQELGLAYPPTPRATL